MTDSICGMEPALVAIVGVIAGVVGVIVVVAVVVGRARARAALLRAREQPSPVSEERERAAGAALVRTDERIRLAEDEMGFAIADFGEQAGAEFTPALDRARQRLSEAFQLNQRLSDHVPDTPEQRREWVERILSLCASADSTLDEVQGALAARRSAAYRMPVRVDEVHAALQRVRDAIPTARDDVQRLAERYSADALAPIATNPDQAEQLLAFAERSREVALSRMSAARDGEADVALQAAAETVSRAESLLGAVESFEVEAIRAEATLAAMVAESQVELTEARALPEASRRGRIDDAVAELERTLAALPVAGAALDPIGALSMVRRANTALDEAVAERLRSAERTSRLRSQLVTAIDDAERQIEAARQIVNDYRAPIGPDARTRLAAAERELAGLTDEREPEPALARARRASGLAAEAAALARGDLTAAQRAPGRVGGAHVLGGVLGGLAIGGLLEQLGDLEDFLD